MRNFSIALAWVGSFLFSAACTPSDPSACYASPYADLSRWFISAPLRLYDRCDGTSSGADVRNAAQTATIVRGEYDGEPGSFASIDARMSVLSGAGRLSAELWEDGPISRTAPGDGGRVWLRGRVRSGRASVTFLAQDDGHGALDWRIESVLISAVEVVP